MPNRNLSSYLSEMDAEYFDTVATFEVQTADIRAVVIKLRDTHGLSLKLVTATDEREHSGCFKIWYVFAAAKAGITVIPYIKLTSELQFPSIALVFPEAFNYERQINTFFGLTPIVHPDTRPIILHENWPANIAPLRKDVDWNIKPADAQGAYEFGVVEGEGIYEIPVGPIHAGIIEPGHFRFSMYGETMMMLEPRLGYTHKGSEKLFENLSIADGVRLSEKISGDSSFSHSLAFCQTVERLGQIEVPERALYLRVIYAELERLANHLGDIGAIMLDAGFNFGGSNGSRLREVVMRINERLTGSRFLRSVNKIGGVSKDISEEESKQLSADLKTLAKDFDEVISIAKTSASLNNRLRGTGTLTRGIALSRGAVGVAARATGIAVDTRVDHPYAAYGALDVPPAAIENTGDVQARFKVRVSEVGSSVGIISQALEKMPRGSILSACDSLQLQKSAVAVSLVEGWRGEILYFITTDARGALTRVVPRDPSYLNWALLSKAIVDNIIPDFPLINKSFNLSYSGNDL
ncbi:MAG: NADH-quinone oxidoreductase subunit C [Raoultibacter sp.]|jgi:Ni,Fe-hydrogenase III large subunit/Ni,Fe-hydrogenase III component G